MDTSKIGKLLRKKNPSLYAKVVTVADFVKPLLGTRPIGSEEFTDHDFAHSMRIAERVAQILPRSCVLNGTELYVLLLAVLLHDSGMWGPKEEVRALSEDDAFCQWADCAHLVQWKQVQEDLRNDSRRWMGEMGLRHLAAIWFRIRHPARLGSYVFDPQSPTGPTLRVLIGEDFIEPVADVAVAHSWDRKRVLEDKALAPREIGTEPVNLRFLASLLRLGDLLDLGDRRISTLLWSYLRPLNDVSEAHWRKEHTLRMRNCTPDSIEVGGHFDISRGGLPTNEAYRLGLQWLEWLDAEIKECTRVVHTFVPFEYGLRCRMGQLTFDRSQVKVEEPPMGDPVGKILEEKCDTLAFCENEKCPIANFCFEDGELIVQPKMYRIWGSSDPTYCIYCRQQLATGCAGCLTPITQGAAFCSGCESPLVRISSETLYRDDLEEYARLRATRRNQFLSSADTNLPPPVHKNSRRAS